MTVGLHWFLPTSGDGRSLVESGNGSSHTCIPATSPMPSCQGPYDESKRYRDFMGWEMPWYSAQASLDALLEGRQIGLMHLLCWPRQWGTDDPHHLRMRTNGRLTAQWARLEAGRSDDLTGET